MTPDAPPSKPSASLSAGTAAEDKIWRITGLSPAAIDAARAAARRAGIPLAGWLAGLIHTVAERERAARDQATPPMVGRTE